MRWQNVELCHYVFYQNRTHTHTQTEHHRAMNMNNESWGVQSYMQPNCVETLQRDCDGTEKLWVVATYQFQFKAWKSTHERIMMIMISSPRTKSNSCAAVQVKSTSSVVTVSLVPSQCSDTHTRIYTHTHKTNASGGWPNALDAFNFSQLLASATATIITTWLQPYSQLLSVLHSSFHFEIFWRHIGYGPYTHFDDVVVRICSQQCLDIATIADRWTASLGILSIVAVFWERRGDRKNATLLHTNSTFVFCSVKKQTNNEYSKKDNALCMYCQYVYIYNYIFVYIIWGGWENVVSMGGAGAFWGGLSIYTHTNIDNNYISKAMVHLQVTTCMLDSLIFSIPTWTKWSGDATIRMSHSSARPHDD